MRQLFSLPARAAVAQRCTFSSSLAVRRTPLAWAAVVHKRLPVKLQFKCCCLLPPPGEEWGRPATPVAIDFDLPRALFCLHSARYTHAHSAPLPGWRDLHAAMHGPSTCTAQLLRRSPRLAFITRGSAALLSKGRRNSCLRSPSRRCCHSIRGVVMEAGINTVM